MAAKKPGRPRTPTAILKLHGTYRKDRRYKSEPVPKVVIPAMPVFLKGEARKEWERLAPLLAQSRCLTEWDRSLLAAYCYEWAIYVNLSEKIKKIGDTVNDRAKSPLLSARNKALKNFKEIATEFGLSPSSRTRIATNPKDGGSSPFAALLNRSKNVG